MALGRDQPIHFPLKQPGISLSWESHRNTPLASGKPNLWGLEAPPAFLLGALLCQVQGNNLEQTQMCG